MTAITTRTNPFTGKPLTETEAASMLMNPFTGSVATLAEWLDDFDTMTPEEWGGESFDDAELIEVILDENGDWIAA